MKKQFLSILLAFCMIVALLPITAMAADDELVITGNAGGYTYSGGVVKIQSGGEYTITMADGVTETTDHIEAVSYTHLTTKVICARTFGEAMMFWVSKVVTQQ